ncbi:MAG: IS66 family transposase, partial [Synergistaceae bacterium]|nr:IS66 family transposase [Synergistaceae bacterium]
MESIKKTIDLSAMTRSELEDGFVKLSVEIEAMAAKLSWYEEQFLLSRAQRFGPSSAKSDFAQMTFFNEAESESYGKIIPEPELETVKPPRKAKEKGHKDKITGNLPTEVIEYKLTPEEQVCPECKGPLHEMDKEVRKELKVIPAQVMVTEHVRYTYACRGCDKNAISVPVITAKAPNPPFRNSLASPSMLAHVITRKYVEAIPLYRQMQQFQRYGLMLSKQTLANWVVKTGVLLKPVYDMMHNDLLSNDVLHADDSVLEVLREPGRDATTDSYMWLYRTSGCAEKPIVMYEYSPGRSGDYPEKFLKGFKGYLHTDAYAGFHKLEKSMPDKPPDITLVGCWSHARAKYDESLKALKNKEGASALLTRQGLEYCNILFRLEQAMEGLPPDERKKRRDEEARPTVEAYFEWAEKNEPLVLAQSLLGKAVTYSLNQRKYLERYLLDGRLELSNNKAERSIKPFVIGRKNWLFSNTPAGADASALLYSIAETAKENDLNPFPYFQYLFEQIPNIDVSDPAAIGKLLPYSDRLPESCRNL